MTNRNRGWAFRSRRSSCSATIRLFRRSASSSIRTTGSVRVRRSTASRSMNDESTVSGLVGRIALAETTPFRASASSTCNQKTPG
jgi:hypothetical protein